VWTAGPWPERFGLERGTRDTGYGHSAAEVAAVRPESAQALIDYYVAVAARTGEFMATVTEAELDRVVDNRWAPPVTLGSGHH